MYADDLLILSPSLNGLQCLLDVCTDYGSKYYITFNAKKTCCIVVGKSFSNYDKLPIMHIGGMCISWVTTFKYLGIVFVAKKNLHVVVNYIKRKYYAALNGLKLLYIDVLLHMNLLN